MCRKANSKKLKVISSNWPRFLVISSSVEGGLEEGISFSYSNGIDGFSWTA